MCTADDRGFTEEVLPNVPFLIEPIIGFVRNWTGVLKYLEEHQCGVKEDDVIDAYPAAADHLRVNSDSDTVESCLFV